MNIALTGGGTGGHVIPHLSLLPYIKKSFNTIIYLGSKLGIEYDIIKPYEEILFEDIPVVKLDKSKILRSIALPFQLLNSVCKCKKILKRHKVDIVFSKGGYVSVPVCIAAKILGIKVVSHESDLTPGLANKIIYRFCDTFCTTFEATLKGKKKVVFTGAPIRQEILKGSKSNAKNWLNLPMNNKKTLLIMGGSTGALSLNEALYTIIDSLLKNHNVIHIVGKGKGDVSKQKPGYVQIEYTSRIGDLLALSDVIISRAGSNAIYEFLALKKPMLLIPLPKSTTSRGDQVENAKYFESLGYAKLLNQEALSPKTLLNAIDDVEKNATKYVNAMTSASTSLNGTKNIYTQIMKVLEH